MKLLFVIIFVATLCRGFPIDTTPRDVGISTQEEGGNLWFVVSWNKLDNYDETDPILGYKVKIWTVKKGKKVVMTANENGEFVEKEIEEIPALDSHNDPPSDELTEMIVAADKTKATYHGMKKGVIYEVAVFAYTANNNGSTTSKMRIELEPDKKA